MDLKLGLHGAVIPQADLITGLKAAAQAGFSAYEPEVAKLIENSNQRQQAGMICEQLKIAWLPLNEIEAFTQEPAHSSEEVLSLAAELSIPAVTVIPRKTTITLPAIDDEQVPQVTFRMQNYYEPSYTAWHKLNNHDNWGLFVHTFHTLVPPEKYFDNHPEYFTELMGERIPGGQICLTNPEVFRIVVDEAY